MHIYTLLLLSNKSAKTELLVTKFRFDFTHNNTKIGLLIHFIKFNLITEIFKFIYPFHPYRPVWYVPDKGKDYTILIT